MANQQVSQMANMITQVMTIMLTGAMLRQPVVMMQHATQKREKSSPEKYKIVIMRLRKPWYEEDNEADDVAQYRVEGMTAALDIVEENMYMVGGLHGTWIEIQEDRD